MAISPDALLMSGRTASDQSAEELGLWADYYEAVSRALDIVRAGGITPATFAEVVAASDRASAVLTRIRQLRSVHA